MNKNKSLKRKKSRASTSSAERADYRATLKRTFRFLTVLLVMLIAGSTGAWAEDSEGKIPITVLVDGTVAEESPSPLEGPIETAGGTVDATGYNETGNCDYLKIVIHVVPKPGYIITLSKIKYIEGDETETNKYQIFDTYYDGSNALTPTDPASSTNLFGSERDITVYYSANPYKMVLKVEFVKAKLTLDHTLGSNAKVTFFDGGTTEPSTATFDPTSYTETSAIASIDNSDGNDRYIIAHIEFEPTASYWTDAQLLSATDETTASTGSTLAGARSASVRAKSPSEEAPRLTLLKADEYDADPSDQVTDMQPRHDGAGWYYYKLPKEHTIRAGYTSSIINGEIVPKFILTDPNNVSQSEKVVTVTDGTENGWSAEITYDKVNWDFDGTKTFPQITKISINKGSEEALTALTTTTAIENQLYNNYSGGQFIVGTNNYIQPTSASSYCWFTGQEGNSTFTVNVPFTPLLSTSSSSYPGTSDNPWIITSAEELDLLAKCVNVGGWYTVGQYIRQTEDIDMSSITDFLPIGICNPGVSFQGHYDGFYKKISNISINYTTASESGEESYAYIGLFGKIEGTKDFPATVDNVTLENCSFSATASSNAVAVGGIAGLIEATDGPEAVKVSNCKVLVNGESAASAISGLSTDCATGAIVGFHNGTLTNNYYGYDVTVTNSSGSASGYTKRGYWNSTSTKWDDITTNDGAMLYVKRATIENGTTGNGSAVTFNETITPDKATATTPANCYSIANNLTPVTYWYAVGQEVTLSVTQGTIQQGARTLTEELTALTMSDGTNSTDIKDTKSFTMPEADATVTPTFTASEWFTVPSNQKKWMTFYHDWKDKNNAAANYTVTDDTGAKTINVWTITAIDAATGSITKKDLGGVSFSGVPTLFNSDNNLPAVLKFTPVTDKTAPTDVATQFKGVAAETTLSGDNIYVMNGDGEFDHAYLPASGSNTLKANRCYIDLGTNSGARRLFFIEEAVTGIGEVTGVAEVTDHGASLNDKGEMINDKWFTLDGRKLDKLPTKKGLYIYKGKLTVIK
jgi:hypothetical protein